MRARLLLLIAVFQVAALPLTAESLPVMVADLNSKQVGGGSMSDLYAVGEQVFFLGTDATHGKELWRSDGTSAGTRLVKDVLAGSGSSGVRMLGQANGILLFAIDSGEERGVWRSDGSEAGTFRVAEVHARNANSLGGLMWFEGTPPGKTPLESEPWRTDGSVAGTFSIVAQQVARAARMAARTPRSTSSTLPPWEWHGTEDSGRYKFGRGGSSYYFIDGSRALWRSGGSAATTEKVGSVPESAGPLIRIVSAGSWVSLLSSGNDEGMDWWSSHGQAGEPVQLLDGATWRSFQPVGRFGDTMVVTVTGSFGRQFWKSDGTAAGTVKVADAPDDWYASPDGFFAAGGRIYFTIETYESGREPWVLDVEAGNIRLLKEIGKDRLPSGASGFRMVGGTVYFTAYGKEGTRVWATRGETRGTNAMNSWMPKGWQAAATGLSSLGDTLYFVGIHPVQGSALWRKDPDAKKAVRLGKTQGGNGSGMSMYQRIHAAEGVAYFTGYDGVRNLAWRSDGTPSGTFPLESPRKGIYPLKQSFSPFPVGGRVVLSGTDPVDPYFRALLISNGKDSPATRIPGMAEQGYPRGVGHMTMSGAALYMISGYDSKLWTTDGTAAGTFPLLPAAGTAASGTLQSTLYPDGNGEVYFAFNNGIWKSDLDARLIRQVDANGFSHVAVHEGGIVFMRTTAGAVRLFKNAGQGGGSEEVSLLTGAQSVVSFTSSAGLLWIVTADGDWENRTHTLWRSNGTGEGTFQLATFGQLDVIRVVPGRRAGDPSLFFVTTTSGNDLWSSDGTPGGTGVLLEDAPAWPSDTDSVVIGSRVYFSGNDGIHGEELWRTDGTASSTVMVADLTGDSGGSAPAQLVRTGNHLFFSAVTAGQGRELYVLDVSADVAAEVADERASVSAAKAGGGEELLLKQAFNLDPEEGMRVMVPGSGRSGLPHFSTAGSGSSRVFRLEFLRHKSGRWGYRPKCSGSLEAGSYVDMTGAETVTDLDADWERVVIEQPLDTARTPRLFGIVEVSER